MFLSAYAMPLAARRLMESGKNITSAESLVVFDDGAVQFNDTDATSRRNLGAAQYHKYAGRDRHGGDLGRCGMWRTEEQIRNQCNRLNSCIGYTMVYGRPWCLKSAASSANMHPARNHDYYAKDPDRCLTNQDVVVLNFEVCTGGILRKYQLYCNEDNGWCGGIPAHQNAHPSTRYDGSAYLECRA